MIMPTGRPLLLPANPKFIAMSFVLALLLHMWLGLLGWNWLPDVLAIVLVFWTVHQPRRVGLVLAFLLGLALDVHESALLGQNALSYVVISGLAKLAQRRMQWFPLSEQALQIFPLFVLAALVEWLTRLVAHDAWPSWSQLPGPVLQAALWPLVGTLLLAPQRRAFERDDIRPI
jgi:rod shape-determining protein MreD